MIVVNANNRSNNVMLYYIFFISIFVSKDETKYITSKFESN